MSTHFRPRPQPPPTPTSPARPSTAHSTIRAITPSPPNSAAADIAAPRPKSEHALGSHELATFARYVVKAGSGDFEADAGSKLQRGGMASGRSSPMKSGRSSPVKSIMGSSGHRKSALDTLEGLSQSPAPDDSPILTPVDSQEEDKGEPSAPYTPTPMTRAQKRLAYTPLGSPVRPSRLQPRNPHLSPPQSPNFDLIQALKLTPPKSVVKSRSSESGGSHHTVASKRSVFSTPGRDELERKKALVEADEGPFARATSVLDLDGERRMTTRHIATHSNSITDNMVKILDKVVKRPYMLNDIAVEAQRLSAALPPDNWDPAIYKSPQLERQPSGVFEFVSGSVLGEAEDDRLVEAVAKHSAHEQERINNASISRRKCSSWSTRTRRWLCKWFGRRPDKG
ncbi:hypothetical protein ACEQ8H_005689 [Pleosporales sp. CAS-2024a]